MLKNFLDFGIPVIHLQNIISTLKLSKVQQIKEHAYVESKVIKTKSLDL